MSLARKLELREQYAALAPRATTRGLLAAHPQRLALPAPPGASPLGPNTVTMEGRPIKRLSTAEQEERCRLGLCYNCDKKFVRGHNRVCKRLFLLDGAVEDRDDPPDAAEPATAEAESPLFSLHAIAGVRFTNTMQLDVVLGGTSLIALLDSGSTHNFISESVAQRTGLPLQRHP